MAVREIAAAAGDAAARDAAADARGRDWVRVGVPPPRGGSGALAAPPRSQRRASRYVVRLTETAAAIAANHLHMSTTRSFEWRSWRRCSGSPSPHAQTLGAAVAAWPVSCAAPAPTPHGFTRPDWGPTSGEKEKEKEGEGAFSARGCGGGALLQALADARRRRRRRAERRRARRGGRRVGGSTSREELRGCGVQHRARLMEITKLCTALCLSPPPTPPRVAQTCALVAAARWPRQTRVPGCVIRPTPGPPALTTRRARRSGTTRFVEPVMQALRLETRRRSGERGPNEQRKKREPSRRRRDRARARRHALQRAGGGARVAGGGLADVAAAGGAEPHGVRAARRRS